MKNFNYIFTSNPVLNTNLPLPLFSKGKVRDIYEVDNNLLIISTDRISAFDVVLPTPIPSRGIILSKLSIFWFEKLKKIVNSHFISSNPSNLKLPENIKKSISKFKDRLQIVNKANVIPVECIVRGYLTGSLWKEYSKGENPWKIKLPKNMKQSEKLPQALFTPTTKSHQGEHDLPITFQTMKKKLGSKLSTTLKNLSLKIYNYANNYCLTKGLILADTKFEFGLIDGKIFLVDEALTPDSSRFWEKKRYKVGIPQESFDKQYIRDYLNSVQWDPSFPPTLPPEVVKETFKKYYWTFQKIVLSE